MNKGNKDIKKIYAFITIVNRFYDYVGELEDNLFSFEELSRMGDHRRAISRDSQDRDIENMIKIIMYGVNDVMRILNSKKIL